MDNSMLTLGPKNTGRKSGKWDFFNPWWETLEDKGVGRCFTGVNGIFSIQIVLSSAAIEEERIEI